MRFAANLSTLLQDIPLLTERYRHLLKRTDYRLEAIECQNPYVVPVEEWKRVLEEKAEGEDPVKWVLINSPPLFDAKFEAIPSTEEYRETVLEKTLSYALALNVPKVHLVMQDVEELEDSTQMSKIIDLLNFGARFMAPHNITCLIEPLSIRQNYYLKSYFTARDIVNTVKQPNLKVMLDTYHLQKLHGNLTENIELLMPFVGHVQVSQVPLRDCPSKDGEVNYRYVLKRIANLYRDYVGLEYNCHSSESFSWMKEFEQI